MNKNDKVFLERNFRSARRDLSFKKIVWAAEAFFEEVNSPKSLACYLTLKYEAYAEYLSLDIRPSDYDCPEMFFRDYQCIKMLPKAEFYPRVYDTQKEAQQSFIDAELSCMATNNRWITEKDQILSDPAVSNIFHIAKRKISRLLGDVPNLSDLNFAFGPGNNVGLKQTTSSYDKLNVRPTCTARLKPLLSSIMEKSPCWANSLSIGQVPTPLSGSSLLVDVDVVVGSELGFVPKSAKTDRPICTEPLMNSYVQKGLGLYLKDRLRRAGNSIKHQTRNQELARIGSITNTLATIDLSSASDTISYMTVLELLPLPWFELLDSARCDRYTFEGRTYSFEKFSSMGNAFTFELETILFLALTRATCEHLCLPVNQVSVYGDDIIVPKDAADLLTQVLHVFGFKVNESKSFTEGPFRESCGKDWFLGEPVRPLFLKKRPTNASIIGWCNHIYRISDGLHDRHYRKLYGRLKHMVPKKYHRLKGPDGYGDGHFICKFEDREVLRRSSYRERGWEGYAYYTLQTVPKSVSTDSVGVYPAALYSVKDQPNISADDPLALLNAKHRLEEQRIRNLLGYGVELNVRDIGFSKEGRYQITRRGSTRTVLRHAFTPWKHDVG